MTCFLANIWSRCCPPKPSPILLLSMAKHRCDNESTKLGILQRNLPEKENDQKWGGGARDPENNWPIYTWDSMIACHLPWKWSPALESNRPELKRASTYDVHGLGGWLNFCRSGFKMWDSNHCTLFPGLFQGMNEWMKKCFYHASQRVFSCCCYSAFI